MREREGAASDVGDRRPDLHGARKVKLAQVVDLGSRQHQSGARHAEAAFRVADDLHASALEKGGKHRIVNVAEGVDIAMPDRVDRAAGEIVEGRWARAGAGLV